VPDPGHGNLPYYKKQLERAEADEMRRLQISCRNSRGANPRCAELAYLSSGSAAASTASIMTLLAAATTVWRCSR
jgi:hypothetical protein